MTIRRSTQHFLFLIHILTHAMLGLMDSKCSILVLRWLGLDALGLVARLGFAGYMPDFGVVGMACGTCTVQKIHSGSWGTSGACFGTLVMLAPEFTWCRLGSMTAVK